MHGLPHAITAPAGKTLEYGAPPAQRLRQHTPGHATAKNPQLGDQKRTALFDSANTNAFMCRQNRVNRPPFLVTDFQSIRHLKHERILLNLAR